MDWSPSSGGRRLVGVGFDASFESEGGLVDQYGRHIATSVFDCIHGDLAGLFADNFCYRDK